MNCASCNKPLELVSDQPMRRSTDWTVQYNNALAIEFSGGYGMFDDPMFIPSRDRTIVICHDCAHNLIANNPWMRAAVDDKHGHMHDSGAMTHVNEHSAIPDNRNDS